MTQATAKTNMQTFELLASGSLAKKAAIVALGSAMLAGLSQISVPLYPVPMTLQTLGVMLIGLTFGFRMASATLALYLLEGIAGIPVFSGFQSGLETITGPKGGYLIGFLIAASLIGLLADRGFTRSWAGAVLALIAGEAIIFGVGAGYLATFIGSAKAIELGVVPFILGDSIKVALALLIGKGLLSGVSRFAKL